MTAWLEQDLRTWIVCEADDRWVIAVRRFAAEMMDPLVPSIQTSDPAQMTAKLASSRSAPLPTKSRTTAQHWSPAVVLWEIRDVAFLDACGYLPSLRIRNPDILLIFAVTDLSNPQMLILGEYGFAAMIRHPEELPKLAGMIQAYFATAIEDLD